MSITYRLIMGDQGSFLSNPTLHNTAWKWEQTHGKKKKKKLQVNWPFCGSQAP
jgi:hypothetical protein